MTPQIEAVAAHGHLGLDRVDSAKAGEGTTCFEPIGNEPRGTGGVERHPATVPCPRGRVLGEAGRGSVPDNQIGRVRLAQVGQTSGVGQVGPDPLTVLQVDDDHEPVGPADESSRDGFGGSCPDPAHSPAAANASRMMDTASDAGRHPTTAVFLSSSSL